MNHSKLRDQVNFEIIGKVISYIKRFGLAAFYNKAIDKIKSNKPIVDNGSEYKNPYQAWIERNEPDVKELNSQRTTRFQYEPKISIIVPVYETSGQFLKDMVESVLKQTYSNWQLCIADGGSKKTYIRELLERYSNEDSRIKVKLLDENKGIAGNLNEALSLADGDYIGFLDNDDLLPPFALFEVTKSINEHPDAKFVYSDSAITDLHGNIIHITFNPDFSRFFYTSYPYIIHLVVIQRNIIDDVGRFDERYCNGGFSHYVDLFLRIFSKSDDKEIIHISNPLYYYRQHKVGSGHVDDSEVHEATKMAINRYLNLKQVDGWVEDGLTFNTFRVRAKISGEPLVSIIIPTKDEWRLLRSNLKSINELAEYKNYEVVIVKNNTETMEAENYLNSIKDECKVINYNLPFNYSEICNYAVKCVNGKFLLFLNDDIEFINKGWLTAMLELFEFQEVGAVGAKLIYPDKKIQHAGVIIGLRGLAEHWHKFDDAYSSDGRHNPGYLQSLNSIREYSAITGACLMTRKYVFEEVGGFSEKLKVGYSDIDLCLKIKTKGYKLLYTPYSFAYHYEHVSRKSVNDQKMLTHLDDNALFKEKWKNLIIVGDPYYNMNLSLEKYIPECRFVHHESMSLEREYFRKKRLVTRKR